MTTYEVTRVGVGEGRSREEVDALVDEDRGIVSRELFIADDLVEMEMEQIFKRAWLFVTHESQIANPGDYFQSRMGTEWVLVCRDNDGEIQVLLNSCRHGGMKADRPTLASNCL